MNKKITRRDFLETMGLMGVSATALAMGLTACSGSGAVATDLEEVWNAYVASKGEISQYFLLSDYDGDGAVEAYAITADRLDDEGRTHAAKIYFISSDGKVSCVLDTAPDGGSLCGWLACNDALNYNPEAIFIQGGNKKFIVWELDVRDGVEGSIILGVKNGKVYQPEISKQYSRFWQGRSDGGYEGYRIGESGEYICIFKFNAETSEFEFVEKKYVLGN